MGETYSIGAVVKLIGLTSHNLRVWEKRHQAVVAERRPSGHRYYTQAQVDRLSLLKRCIECGYSIGELAKLDDQRLQKILDEHSGNKSVHLKQIEAPTLAVFGRPKFAAQLTGLPKLELVIEEEAVDFTQIHVHPKVLALCPSVMVLDVPSLTDANVLSISELAKRASPVFVILIYRFGSKKRLSTLRHHGIRLFKAPIDENDLSLLLSDMLASDREPEKALPNMASPYPAHLYSQSQLSKISDLPSKVDCECPHHLVEILEALKEFERYSGDCLSKNDEDAALHGKVQLATAGARRQMEVLLQEVLAFEGIEI